MLLKKMILLPAMACVLALSGCAGSSENNDETEITTEEGSSERGSEESSKEESTKRVPSDSGELAELEETETTTEAPHVGGLTDEQKEMYDNSRYPQLEEMKQGETTAVIKTNMGDIKLRFFPEKAPNAVENFLTHAKEGYYDNLIFHRVIDNFVIQGGDPEGTGMGGESIWGEPFDIEVSASLRHFRGALAMANSGRNSNGSQFYIVQTKEMSEDAFYTLQSFLTTQDNYLVPEQENFNVKIKDVFSKKVIEEYLENSGAPELDYGYTVFGQVYEGMDVVDAIAAVETNEDDKPLQDVVIQSIEVNE